MVVGLVAGDTVVMFVAAILLDRDQKASMMSLKMWDNPLSSHNTAEANINRMQTEKRGRGV